MKNKKSIKSKILVPALAVLALTTTASVTSTVAWFAANSTVSATGMSIKATSDNSFLAISLNSTIGDAISVTSEKKEELKPAALNVGHLTADFVSTPGNWYYMYSNDLAVSKGAGEKQTLSSLEGYVVTESYYIGLSTKSGANTANNLRLTSITLPENTGISAVVTCETKAYNFTTSNSSANSALADTVSKGVGTEVKVYYYINGEDTNVYSNNISALTGTVKLNFDVNAA